MIWTRRGFLKLAITAAAGAVVRPVSVLPGPTYENLLDLEFNASGGIVRTDYKSAAICDLFVEHLGQPNTPAWFAISRTPGAPLVAGGLNPGWYFRWIAAPGEEIIIGDGLLNESDANVRLRGMTVRLGCGFYHWSDGRTVAMDVDAPRIVINPFVEELKAA